MLLRRLRDVGNSVMAVVCAGSCGARRLVVEITSEECLIGRSLWVRASQQLLDEGFIRDETIFILFLAQFLGDCHRFLLFQGFAQRHENVLELGQKHLAVILLVVELQALQEVIESAGILGVLDLSEDGEELIGLQELLLLHLGSAELLDLSEGWVQIECTEHVADVEGVHRLVALEIVDGEGELSPLHIPGAELVRHFSCWIS